MSKFEYALRSMVMLEQFLRPYSYKPLIERHSKLRAQLVALGPPHQKPGTGPLT